MRGLFGWSDQVWTLLDQWDILLSLLTNVVTLVLMVTAFLNRERLRRWLWGQQLPRKHAPEPGSPVCEGVVFTVSKPDLPLWVLEQLTPRAVGLVATEFSKGAAEAIAAQAKEKGIRVLPIVQMRDPDDITESRRACAMLLTELVNEGYAQRVVDVTGGKVPMSLGAFLAAQEASCATMYVTAKYSPKGKPDPRSVCIRWLTRPKDQAASDGLLVAGSQREPSLVRLSPGDGESGGPNPVLGGL